jgi:hypothetical protein
MSHTVNEAISKEQFDVFISYNSLDQSQIIEVYKWLKKTGLKPWLDIFEARPGLAWQDAIQDGIENSKAVAVFVGQSNLGPWETPEMNAALREQVARKCPVIPVILPGIEEVPRLPLFLQGNTWVDFSAGLFDATARYRLYWGITGKKLDSIVEEPKDPSSITTPNKVFLANEITHGFEKLYENVIEPILTAIGHFATLQELRDKNESGLAQLIEEGINQAKIVLFVLSNDTPFIPLPLQKPLPADKTLIVLLEKGITLPAILLESEVIEYRNSQKAIQKLTTDLTIVLNAALEGNRLQEAEKLLRLGYPEAAVVSGGNHLGDFLRSHAISHLGYRYFQEKPIRYYSISDLFKLLFQKGKLQTHVGVEKIDWKKLIELRNIAAHGTAQKAIDFEKASWYVQTVRKLILFNTE